MYENYCSINIYNVFHLIVFILFQEFYLKKIYIISVYKMSEFSPDIP